MGTGTAEPLDSVLVLGRALCSPIVQVGETHVQVNVLAQSWESRTESPHLQTHACPAAC